MATYKLTYTLDNKKWIRYVNDVSNENVAVIVGNIDNPEIPQEASVKVEFVCE